MRDFYGVNIRKTLIVAAVAVAVLLGIYATYNLSFYLAPFIIALLMSMILEPIIQLLTRTLKMGRKLAALVALLFVLVTLGVVLILIIIKLVNEIKSLAFMLPRYLSEIYSNILTLVDKANDVYKWLPGEITFNIESNLGDIISSISNSLMKIANSIFGGAYATVILLPEALVFILITILCTYFIASDRDRIVNFFISQLPEVWVKKAISIKEDMFAALFGYIKAQLILMSITFTELFTGFSLIGVRYTVLLAFIIAIIDAFPILGTGGVLIPWSIYSFLTGDIKRGISLLALYLTVLIVRQLVEPKVLSYQIGVHPLLTLVAMYAGLQLIGFPGLILGPITILLLKNVFSGILKGRTIKEMLK
jgi:sporulation integral membrane protein YtvI